METEKEVDFLKFQRRVNTLLGMPFYVNSMDLLGEKFGSVLTGLHRVFTEGIVALVTAGQLWAVPYIFEDMNILCGCLSSSAHSSQVIAKTALLSKCKTQYLNHIKEAHLLQNGTDQFEFLFLRRETSFAKYHKKQSKYINVIVIIQLVVNFASTSAYFLPFIYDSIVNQDDVKHQLTPIVVYMSMDFNYTPLFQIVVVTLTVGFYVVNLKTVVIDNFVLSLIVLHISELKYHNGLLKEAIEKDRSFGGIRKDMIRAWIKQHQALTSLCNDFQKLISPFLFIEFSYILIHTCVPAFVITSTFSWTLPQKVAVFCMVGGGLIELFLISSAGGVFSDAWLEIGSVLFRSEIVVKEKWTKQIFMIIQQKIQNPFRLSALSIIPLNRGAFASVLRLIFSYYMTLNQIQKIKHQD